jgi:hypothetical protein
MRLKHVMALFAAAGAALTAGFAGAQSYDNTQTQGAPSPQESPPAPGTAQPAPEPAMPGQGTEEETQTTTQTQTTQTQTFTVQAPQYQQYPETPTQVNPGAWLMAPHPDGSWQPKSTIGIGILGGGGATNFVDQTMRNASNVGGTWLARVALGTRSWVGAEASYVGAAQTINGLGLATNNTSMRNGLETGVRLQAPFQSMSALFEPYIFGGLGWDHYRFNSNVATADINRSGNGLVVPAGVGFNMSVKGFMFDARGEYRPTYFNNFLTTSAGTGLTNWSATGSVGYEF